MICTKCGCKLPDDAKFCLKCGCQIEQSSSNDKKDSDQINPVDKKKKTSTYKMSFFTKLIIIIVLIACSLAPFYKATRIGFEDRRDSITLKELEEKDMLTNDSIQKVDEMYNEDRKLSYFSMFDIAQEMPHYEELSNYKYLSSNSELSAFLKTTRTISSITVIICAVLPIASLVVLIIIMASNRKSANRDIKLLKLSNICLWLELAVTVAFFVLQSQFFNKIDEYVGIQMIYVDSYLDAFYIIVLVITLILSLASLGKSSTQDNK